MKQNQDRGLKPSSTGENQQPPPPQQQPPQKCPRCESLNTKFCYYNNYSLSQPRYFCKACRRYWTQGGTLRNVPVGGGCRKGKRTRISSSSSSAENSRYSQLPQMIPQQQQNLISSPPILMISATKETSAASLASPGGSYYPGGGGGGGGGFFSSLAAIQSMNQPNQVALSLGGGELGGSSSLGLFQGYAFGSQQHQQTQFFDMGNTNREKSTVNTYPSDHQELGLIHQSTRPAAAATTGGSNSHQPNWHQSNFLNDINNPTVVSEAANLWSSINNSSSTAAGNTNTTGTGTAAASSSFNPNQWPHLPGYGAAAP